MTRRPLHRRLAKLAWIGVLSIALASGLVAVLPLDAQTAVSVDGVVESTSGGFKFPGGAVVTTAPVGTPVDDSGQRVCFDHVGSAHACAGTGEDAEFQVGVAWPTPRFLDNGDGTVTDHLTGLTWLQDADCPGDDLTWQGALDWVVQLNTSGAIVCSGYAAMTFTDWRLPNANELQSLLDRGQSSPALPSGHPFASVQLEPYWSSSTSVQATQDAWSATLVLGESSAAAKTNEERVWPVRGGL